MKADVAAAIETILVELDPHGPTGFLEGEDAFQRQVEVLLARIPDHRQRERLWAWLFGWGPLQPFLDDPAVTELSFNRHDSVFVVRKGGPREEVRVEIEPGDIFTLLESQLARSGVQLSQFRPLADSLIVDRRSKTRWRITARDPSITNSVDGQFTLRRQTVDRPTLEFFERQGILDRRTRLLLAASVRAGKTILVAGSLGVGKTTFLTALYHLVPDHLRIATIEEVAELPPRPGNIAVGLTRSAGAEGTGSVTFADLLRADLRNAPDAIVLGEVRDAEAVVLLQAMRVFRGGCLGTIHGRSALDALEQFAGFLVRGDIPATQAARQVAAAVDLVVYLAIDRATGTRCVTEVIRPSMGTDGLASIPIVRHAEEGRWDLLDVKAFRDLGLDPGADPT